MSIAANKIEGIRASNVTTVETAIQSVEHNNANVLCLGSNNLSQSLSKEIAINFFSSLLLEEDRYVRRIEKITKIENSN
jgi:ribose 5-phosphate isomerase B